MKRTLISLLFAAALVLSCGRSSDEMIAKKIQSFSEMSELGTVEYTVKKIIKADDASWYKYGDRKILISCTAFLKAGIDMKGFSADRITVSKATRSITAVLPKARLLSFNMPPEMIIQEFSRVSGLRFNFTPEEKQDLMAQAEGDILKDVPTLGILEDAENNAAEFFRTWFSQIGYDNITVKFE